MSVISRLRDNFALHKVSAPLLVILGAALAIRLLFFVGVTNQSDLIQASRSAALANIVTKPSEGLPSTLTNIRHEMGGLRNLIFYAPYIAIYSVFGVTQASSLAIPIFVSLANICIIYSIAKFILDERAALFASLLWAFFPLDIFFSTASLETNPKIFFFLLSVYLACIALHGGKAITIVVLAASAGILALYEPWLAASFAFFVGVQWLSGRSRSTRTIGTWVILAGTALLVARPAIGEAFLSFYGLILDQPEFVFLLPLIFVAIAKTLGDHRAGQSAVFVWAGAVLIGSVGKLLSSPIFGESGFFTSGPFLLSLFAPLTILVGSYFAGGLKAVKVAVLARTLALAGTVAAGLALIGAEQFLPAFDNFNWIGLHSLFLIFYILAGVAFAASLASPIFLTGKEARWKQMCATGLLLIVLLAALPFTWKRMTTFRYLVDSPEKAWQFLKNAPYLQIYTPSIETRDRLTLQATIEGENYQTESFVVADVPSKIQDGYLVAFEGELNKIPSTWLHVGSFGDLGFPRVVVYRVLPVQKAAELLHAAQASSATLDIYTAGVSAGEFCIAYEAWALLPATSGLTLQYIPIYPDSDCFVIQSSLLDLEDLQRSGNIEGYITFPHGSPDSDSPAISVIQISLPIYDKRTVSIDVKLEPNTLYLYSVDILTLSPTATLYWKLDELDDYQDMRSYPEWTTVSMLMRTPNWDNPKTLSFSPALFDHIDPVSFRNLYLGQVDFKQQ